MSTTTSATTMIEPSANDSSEDSDRKRWLDAFIIRRGQIEQGIRDDLKLDQRGDCLQAAQRALPDVDLEDMSALEDVADLLEAKLEEMLDVISGCARGPLSEIKLPPGFDPRPHMELLRHATCRDERRWLFVGGLQEILYQYRDRCLPFLLDDRKRLLDRLSSGVEKALDAIEQLNGYLVVEQSFDADQRQQIELMVATAQRVNALYQTTLTSSGDAGLAAMLENNYYRLETQFCFACAKLCLQLFGSVSVPILKNLLAAKSMASANVGDPDPASARSVDAKRKRLEGVQVRALKAIFARASTKTLPVWPILQLYRYDQRYGRAKALKLYRGT